MTSFDALSTRERQVFDLIVAGTKAKAIAVALGIDVKTVSCYRIRLCEKLGVRTDAQLATLHCAARLSVADDHALVAAALCAGVARWEPPTDELRGRVRVGTTAYVTDLDDAGVPILTNLLRDALTVALPFTAKAMAA